MHIEETKTGQARINEKFKYLNAICHETLVVNGGGWGEIKGHQECSSSGRGGGVAGVSAKLCSSLLFTFGSS